MLHYIHSVIHIISNVYLQLGTVVSLSSYQHNSLAFAWRNDDKESKLLKVLLDFTFVEMKFARDLVKLMNLTEILCSKG